MDEPTAPLEHASHHENEIGDTPRFFSVFALLRDILLVCLRFVTLTSWYRWSTVRIKLSQVTEYPMETREEREPLQESPSDRSLEKSSKLTSVNFESDMPLQPTFYKWTLSTLHNASSSLTKVAIECEGLPTSTCISLLQDLSLPMLEDLHFDIVILEDQPPASQDAQFSEAVREFFLRHPNISSLKWDFAGRISSAPLPRMDIPVLSNLVFLEAHPRWIVNLLGMLESVPDALSRLETVVVRAMASREHFNYGQYDPALGSIANLGIDRNISLELYFPNSKDEMGIDSWLSEHVQLGCGGSVVSSLACVSTLEVSFSLFLNLKAETVARIPQWLKLFPCLHHVIFPDQFEALLENPRKRIFVEDLVRSSPRLQTLRIEREVIDLSIIRGGLDCGNPLPYSDDWEKGAFNTIMHG